MEQNYKEFNKRQVFKIDDGIQQAKIKGRKVAGYLSGGDTYYFMALKSIRSRSLFLSILWGCFGSFFILGCLRIIFIMNSMVITLENSSDGASSSIYYGMISGGVVLSILITLIVVAFVMSIKAYRLRLAPEWLTVYLIYNTVISVLLVLVCFGTLFSGSFTVFGLIFGCLFGIAAFVSGMALIDLDNYRDWFVNFGKRKKNR